MSPSLERMSPSSEKQEVLNWKYFTLLYSVCNQTVNLETDAKTVIIAV